MICPTIQGLRQNIVSGVLNHLLLIWHILIASVMVTSQKNQISKLPTVVIEILFIIKHPLVAGIVVWQNVLDKVIPSQGLSDMLVEELNKDKKGK